MRDVVVAREAHLLIKSADDERLTISGDRDASHAILRLVLDKHTAGLEIKHGDELIATNYDLAVHREGDAALESGALEHEHWLTKVRVVAEDMLRVRWQRLAHDDPVDLRVI